MSDLHLESQDFPWPMPQGDVLILAGDLCHAACLDPSRTDLYAVRQRERVLRFIDTARACFAHVLLIAGNHDHYDGIFDTTIDSLRRSLPGITVLDNGHAEIGGIDFFGATLWSDFEGRSEACMNGVRRGVGEFFFVKKRTVTGDGSERLMRFRPEDALVEFDRSLEALGHHLAGTRRPTVVITHHAPSRQGLNPLHTRGHLDGAYASNLDAFIATLAAVPVWVHGHTHAKRTYRIGETTVRANCRGFDKRDAGARAFSPGQFFGL